MYNMRQLEVSSLTKHQLQFELDRMTEGRYSPYNISDLTDAISWMWKWRKITEEEKNSMVDQAISIMQSGGYSVYR